MAELKVTNLTFSYEGSFDQIFENVSFMVDTDWKLGLIGRNGKGKTTFLKLLLNKYPYVGSIKCDMVCEYFPFRIEKEKMQQCGAELMEEVSGCEAWKLIRELDKMQINAEVLYRPFETLSHGERTKVMLAAQFAKDNFFVLIDEPTNHLDMESREIVKAYLKSKKGFILVSHDRDLLDCCIDHVLVLNRQSITVEKGNFSSWWENKSRKDAFANAENEKHKSEIDKLKRAARQKGEWAAQNEQTKIGFDPVKEHDRSIDTRAYIGSKTKKMQKGVKNYEKRMDREIEAKEGLLVDLETPVDLKLVPIQFHKQVYIWSRDFGVSYVNNGDVGKGTGANIVTTDVLENLTFDVKRGERVVLRGKNGCGKSTLIKTILAQNNLDLPESQKFIEKIKTNGVLEVASGLKISYINQDTSFLRGNILEYAKAQGLDETIFLAILRQLDFERTQFSKNMEEYSQGQRKKILIASSLLQSAHLYIWDEPLNYIDVFSRMQIEKLIVAYQPTMLLVEHDVTFTNKIATKIVEL